MLALGLGLGMTLGGGIKDPPTAGFEFTGGVLDPRITFTRGSTAYRVNSSGVLENIAINLPRFDYNPTTLSARGLLVEESRTNLALRSQEFDNATWTKQNCTISANSAVAPDGTTTMDKIVENNDVGQTHQVVQGYTKAASALPYTRSIWVKAAERTKVRLSMNDNAGADGVFAIFDLGAGIITSQGTFGAATWTNQSARIEAWPNGVYRCILRGTSAALTDINESIRLLDAAGANPYNGDGTSGLFVWGAQLEQAEFETSYIPTTTVSVTRGADITAITGGNFSGFFNAAAGTFLVIGSTGKNDSTLNQFFLQCHDGTNAERLQMRRQPAGTASDASAVHLSVFEATLAPGSIGDFTRFKESFAYASNDTAASVNGGAVVTDATVTLPSGLNAMAIGESRASANFLNGWIESVQYWNTRKPNTFLQASTT